MDSIGAFETKMHLAERLDRVEHGESVTFTRHGKPVAQLVPVSMIPKGNRADAIRELRNFGQGRKLDGIRILDLIEEGRRI